MTEELDEPMTEQDDDALLAQLRAAAQQVDPVPDHLRVAARSQFAYLRLDAELAELVHDSASVADAATAGVRSGGDAVRTLSFASGNLQIEVEIVPELDRYRVIGQCLPPAEVEVELRSRVRGDAAGTSATTTSDELGRFTLDAAGGTLSLRATWVHLDQAVETSWVSV